MFDPAGQRVPSMDFGKRLVAARTADIAVHQCRRVELAVLSCGANPFRDRITCGVPFLVCLVGVQGMAGFVAQDTGDEVDPQVLLVIRSGDENVRADIDRFPAAVVTAALVGTRLTQLNMFQGSCVDCIGHDLLKIWRSRDRFLDIRTLFCGKRVCQFLEVLGDSRHQDDLR
jgi:hypothetical protein